MRFLPGLVVIFCVAWLVAGIIGPSRSSAADVSAPPGATVPVPTVLVQTIYDYLMAGGTISEAKSLASQLAEAATAQQREAVEQRKREDEIKRRVEEAVAAKAKEAPTAPAVPGAK